MPLPHRFLHLLAQLNEPTLLRPYSLGRVIEATDLLRVLRIIVSALYPNK